MEEKKHVERILKEQLILLFEHSGETKKVEEICSLNKEICRTVKILHEIANSQIEN